MVAVVSVDAVVVGAVGVIGYRSINWRNIKINSLLLFHYTFRSLSFIAFMFGSILYIGGII